MSWGFRVVMSVITVLTFGAVAAALSLSLGMTMVGAALTGLFVSRVFDPLTKERDPW